MGDHEEMYPPHFNIFVNSVAMLGSVADPDPNPNPDPNPDPDPPVPRVFGPPGSGSGSFYHLAKIIRKTLISTVL
jgi:hypothetical protein